MQSAKRRQRWTEMSGYWQTPWLTGSRQGPSNMHVEGRRNTSNRKYTARRERKEGARPSKLNGAWPAVRTIGKPAHVDVLKRERHATSVQSQKCGENDCDVGKVAMHLCCMSQIERCMFADNTTDLCNCLGQYIYILYLCFFRIPSV